MTLLMVLLTIAVVAGVSAVVAGVVTGGLAEPAAPIPARALPAGPLTGPDVARLRFVQGFRGYRMDQVDAAMDQLAAEIDRLRGLLPEEATGRPDRFGSPEPAAGAEAWEQPAAWEQAATATGEQPAGEIFDRPAGRD